MANPTFARDRAPDLAAGVTLLAVALLCLIACWKLPWWEMQARAPQYGQRTLLVQVNPRGVSGDTFEVDALGHYVGIRKMETFAPLERKLAPLGLVAALAGVLAAPFFRKRWLRALAVSPAVLMPIVFCVDLYFTMGRAANDRDPDAALNLIFTRIDTKLFGEYVVAQFRVTAVPAEGLWLAGVAALLSIGLIFAAPWPFPRRARTLVAAAATAVLLFPFSSRAAELRVGPQDSVAAALAAARDGDRIVVSGVHHEHVAVRARVSLNGLPGSALDGGGEGTVLRIEAPDVEVVGLDVRGSGDVYSREDSAIRIEHVPGVKLRDFAISDALFGIFAAQADRCQLEDLRISGKKVPADRRGDGIRLWYSSGCSRCCATTRRSRSARSTSRWRSPASRSRCSATCRSSGRTPIARCSPRRSAAPASPSSGTTPTRPRSSWGTSAPWPWAAGSGRWRCSPRTRWRAPSSTGSSWPRR